MSTQTLIVDINAELAAKDRVIARLLGEVRKLNTLKGQIRRDKDTVDRTTSVIMAYRSGSEADYDAPHCVCYHCVEYGDIPYTDKISELRDTIKQLKSSSKQT